MSERSLAVKGAAVLLAAASAITQTVQACDSCNFVLTRGPFNTVDIRAQADIEWAISTLRADSALGITHKKVEGSATIPPFFGGAEAEENAVNKTSSTAAKAESGDDKRAVSILLQYASPELLGAWERVNRINHRYGLSATIRAQDKDQMTVSMSWIPTSRGGADPVIKSVDCFGGSISQEGKKILRPGSSVPYGHQSLSFIVRKDAGKTANIVVQTDMGSATARGVMSVDTQAQEALRLINRPFYYLHLLRAPTSIRAWLSEQDNHRVDFEFVNHEGRRGTGSYYFDGNRRVEMKFQDREAAGLPAVVGLVGTSAYGDIEIAFIAMNGDKMCSEPLNRTP